MNFPTNEQIVAEYKLLLNNPENSTILKQVQNSGKLCALYIAVTVIPQLAPQLLVDGILIGMAIAEKRQLEELAAR